MQLNPKLHRYHGHRYHLEQDAILAEQTGASDAERAICNLAERLKAIEEAEHIRARSYMTMAEHYRVFVTLAGRTPDEARADAQLRFDHAYSAAVFAERVAA